VRPRTTARLYNAASRLWLTGAVLALLLPERTRLGVWLPLHLTLAGAVAVAISGAMQNFASALTATPAPPERLVWAQFAFVNVGTALIAIGYPSSHSGLVAAGGASFLCGFAILGWIVVRARRLALNKRHPLPLAMYMFAVTCLLVGGTLGAFVGSGAIHDPDLWTGFRNAHMTLNVLGFVSLTIAGTLVTLLPTVLRIRMPSWHGTATGLLFAAGVVMIASGLALRATPLAAIGGVAYAGGALGLGWMVVRSITSEKRWPVPVSAKHLVLAATWFVAGTLALAVALLGGVESFDRFREVYLTMFVGGWIVQALLGAWQYLLPMARPAHPDERRRFLAAIEFGGTLELVALNAGLVLLALHAAGWVSGALASLGAGSALGGGGLALVKAWAFAPMSRSRVMSKRQLEVWGA
jgi:nitrite reductase (NO-forming)